jgi:hypothetical protein
MGFLSYPWLLFRNYTYKRANTIMKLPSILAITRYEREVDENILTFKEILYPNNTSWVPTCDEQR